MEGQADVIDTIFRMPEREKAMDFSRPYAEIQVTIYTHTKIGGIVDMETLRGFLVGVVVCHPGQLLQNANAIVVDALE